MVRVVLLASVAALGQSTSVDGTPVEKVVGLLERIDRQVTQEGKEEAAEYDKFACFCKEQADDKLYAIEKSEQLIKDLTASIEDLATRIQQDEADIKTLGERIEAVEGEIKSKTDTRKTGRENYEDEAADIKGAISAVEKAVKALTESKDKLKGDAKKMLFLQETAQPLVMKLLEAVQGSRRSATSGEQFQRLMALVQDFGSKPGKAHAYNYKSNDVIDILKNLKKDFLKELKDADEAEFQKKAEFDSLILDLSNEKKFKEEDKTQKEENVARMTKEKAKAEGDKEDETQAKKADNAFMKELTSMCEDKSTIWDQRSKTRAAELTALAKAIDELKSGASSAYGSVKLGLARAKTAVSQRSRHGASFLQLRQQHATTKDGVLQQLTSLLTSANMDLKSDKMEKVLAALKYQGDFSKVKDLLDDLIAKLEDEGKKAADQKDFCSKGIKEAMERRDSNTVEIEKKESQIARMQADNKVLKGEMNTIMKELAELHKSISEQEELRAVEKADNQKSLEECKAGKDAVESALEVLKTFYEGAGFVQRSPKDRDGNALGDMAPETSFDGDYKGKQKQSKGVIGLLETILSDFESTITSVEADEEAAQKEFEDMNKEVLDNIKKLETDNEDKDKTVKENVDNVLQFKEDVLSAKQLHASSLKELEKLQAMCIAGASSWEERAKQREQEIESLKKAKELLDKFDKF